MYNGRELPRHKQIARPFNLNKDDFPDYKSYKKEYDRLYSLDTKERRREIYKLNREYKCNQAKEYRDNNPEKMKKYNERKMELYYKEKNKRKSYLLNGWKRAGMIIFEGTFDHFENTTHCESCNCELIKGKGYGSNRKVLDHCHHSRYPRNVLCHSCNIKRRGYDNKKNIVHLELYRYFNRKTYEE